ncbi:hypothetical protein, partial [Fusobacterium sp.]|uniref:hypothetical protein n=1 Tax=Fusobacterium sp. TaxID=68766 RepID=UPI00263811F5
MENITDKELLAICNLSNLKMEFANLIEKEETKTIEKNGKKETVKIYTNHTIYSLLEKEIDAIKSNNIDERAFFKKKEENSQSKGSNKEKEGKIPIYSNIIDLQKEAGIVYEYFEKKDLGNFLNNWEILFAGDTYNVITNYYDRINDLIDKKLRNSYSANYIFETFKEDDNQNIGTKVNVTLTNDDGKKNVYINNLPLANTNLKKELIEFIEEDLKNIIGTKIEYPSRVELEEIKKNNQRIDLYIKIVGLSFVLIPIIAKEVKLARGMLKGEIDRFGKTAIDNTLNSITRKISRIISDEDFLNSKLGQQKLKKEVQKILNSGLRPKNLKEVFYIQKENFYNNLKYFFDGENFTKEMKVIIKNNDSWDKIKIAMLELITGDNGAINKGIDYIKGKNKISTQDQVVLFLEKLKNEIGSGADIKELDEIKAIFDASVALIHLKPLLNHLNIMDEDFGIMLLRNRKELVICFKNNPNYNEKINDRNINHELMMMELFNTNILSKYLEDDSEIKITITGFGNGAELATIYYYTFFKTNEVELKIFSHNKLDILTNGFFFLPENLGTLYSHKYLQSLDIVKENFDFTSPEKLIEIGALLLFGGVGIAPVASFLLWQGISTGIDIFLNKINNYRYDKMYKIICKEGFFQCENKENCNYEDCKIISKDIKLTYPSSIEVITDLLTQTRKLNVKIYKKRSIKKEKLGTYYEYYEDFIKDDALILKLEDYLKLRLDILFSDPLNRIENIKFYLQKDNSLLTRDYKYFDDVSYLSNKEIGEIDEVLKTDTSEKTIKFLEEKRDNSCIYSISTFKYFFYKIEFIDNSYTIKKYIKLNQFLNVFYSGDRLAFSKVLIDNEVFFDENTLFNLIIWNLKTFSKYNSDMRNNFSGKIIQARFLTNRIKVYNNLKTFLNDKNKSIYGINEFYYLPYIDDNGDLKTRANGETSYLDINNNYIGSVFRNIIEDLQANSINDINFPKFYNEKIDGKKSERTENSLVFKIEDKYSKKLSSKNDTLDMYFNYEKGKYLNLEFIKKFDEYLNKLNKIREIKGGIAFYMVSNNGLYKGYNSLEEVIKKIKTKPEILEKFYIFSNSKESPVIKELRIGHLNGSEHNPEIFEYVYNPKDDMKKGILIIKVGIPKCLEDSFKENASKTPLLNQATLICTAGSEYPKFVVTSNTNFKIQNLSVGLS